MKITFDSEKCTLCGLCIKTCTEKNGAPRLSVEQSGDKIILRQCKQCAKPACALACTYELINRNKTTGAMEVLIDECQGCHPCIRACPFKSAFVHPETDVAWICDLCQGHPECVKACSTGALSLKE